MDPPGWVFASSGRPCTGWGRCKADAGVQARVVDRRRDSESSAPPRTRPPFRCGTRQNVGMNLSHTVRVPVGLDEAWAAVNDPRRLAPAVPGAVVETFDGDRFTGTLKLKLGPLPLAFDGSGHYAERDESAHRLVLRTS